LGAYDTVEIDCSYLTNSEFYTRYQLTI